MDNLKKNFTSICYSEFWLRISYYGFQSLLVIFLTTSLHMTHPQAFATYGTFSALAFGFGVIGGLLSDKHIGPYYSLVIGSLLLFLGNFLLINGGLTTTYIGTSTIVLGLGLLKPTNACFVGLIYDGHNNKKGKAFSIFYMVANLGSIIGPLLYGIGTLCHNYVISFSIGSAGMLICAIVFILSPNLKKNANFQNHFAGHIKAALVLSAGGIIIYLFISNILHLDYFVAPALITLLLYSVHIYKETPLLERVNIIKLLIPMISSIICFAFLLQIYSSVIIFIKLNLHISILGIAIPPNFYPVLEGIFVIFSIPVLTLIWRTLRKTKILETDNNKIIVGLLFLSLCFMLFSLSAISTSPQMILFFIIAASFVLALSEMSVLASSITLINKLSPKKHKGRLMGLYYFSLMFSGYLSGKIAGFSPQLADGFSSYFFILALFILGSVIVLGAISYYLNRKIMNHTAL